MMRHNLAAKVRDFHYAAQNGKDRRANSASKPRMAGGHLRACGCLVDPAFAALFKAKVTDGFCDEDLSSIEPSVN